MPRSSSAQSCHAECHCHPRSTGAAAETGRGDGEGFTLNVPLPGLAGDAAARATFEEVVGPAARRFKPDLIVVSAGYDAHWRDPLANLQFRTSTFHWLVQQTRALAEELCGGRVMFVLEVRVGVGARLCLFVLPVRRGARLVCVRGEGCHKKLD